MIVLDTNIVSEPSKRLADPNVMAWLDRQDASVTFLCGPTLMELSYGGEKYLHKTGSRRYLDDLEINIQLYLGNILEFTDPAPVLAGKLKAERERMGRPISTPDSMIAAICLVNGARLATRNVRDFEGLGLQLINPFEAAA